MKIFTGKELFNAFTGIDRGLRTLEKITAPNANGAQASEQEIEADIQKFQARLCDLGGDLIKWMSTDKKSLRLSQWEALMAIISGIADIENQWFEIKQKYLDPSNQ